MKFKIERHNLSAMSEVADLPTKTSIWFKPGDKSLNNVSLFGKIARERFRLPLVGLSNIIRGRGNYQIEQWLAGQAIEKCLRFAVPNEGLLERKFARSLIFYDSASFFDLSQFSPR